MTLHALCLQALYALGYYLALLVLVRVAGKRLAGQTTTFDLIVLIAMGVAIQNAALAPGGAEALVFVATVLAAHRLLALLCAKSTSIRHLVRGKPRILVRDGRALADALDREGISEEELRAGLRKVGYEKLDEVRIAVLEETGHISAVPRGK